MPSQPNQFDSSAPVHSDASRCHRRRTFPASRQSSKLVLTAAANSSWSLYDWRLTCGLVSDLPLVSTASRSLSKASANIFFFQAEDGIRDVAVTGVQTCALPI